MYDTTFTDYARATVADGLEITGAWTGRTGDVAPIVYGAELIEFGPVEVKADGDRYYATMGFAALELHSVPERYALLKAALELAEGYAAAWEAVILEVGIAETECYAWELVADGIADTLDLFPVPA